MTDWFLPPGTPGSADAWCFRTIDTRDVRIFVNYQDYYARLADLFAQMRDGDEVFFVGWGFDLDVELKNKATALHFLKDAAKRKRARLVATLGHQWADNKAQVAKAEKAKVEAVLDDQLLPGQLNHQKAVFIRLARSSHLFLGGMDVSTGRIGGWIDVQAEVIGAGASLGAVTLEERWESVKPSLGAVSATQKSLPGPDDKPKHTVQFVRTYSPFPTGAAALKTWKRTYAKKGDHTYYALISRAIAAAKKSIYLEEQFLWVVGKAPKREHDAGGSKPRLRSDVPDIPATLEKLLAEAIGRGVHVVIIGPNYDGTSSQGERKRVTDQLASKRHPPLLLMVQPDMMFVHSKVWIFDDEFVVVGSANFWDKSFVSTFRPAEGEFGVGFTSTAKGDALGFPEATFARALRVRLWERIIQSRHPGFTFPRKRTSDFSAEAKELTKNIKGKPVLIPM
jgi:phosphatidylserine/phosphatidylglycerophosphate/cardiolipin synthase-like enzyme